MDVTVLMMGTSCSLMSSHVLVAIQTGIPRLSYAISPSTEPMPTSIGRPKCHVLLRTFLPFTKYCCLQCPCLNELINTSLLELRTTESKA